MRDTRNKHFIATQKITAVPTKEIVKFERKHYFIRYDVF